MHNYWIQIGGYSNDRIKLHDAACVIGRARLQLKRGKTLQSYQLALRAVVEESLHNSWHSSKFALFLKLSGEVGRLDVLVDIATEELFHEMGIWSEIETYLVQGAEDKTVNPDQRIKALDGLAFYDLKTGSDRATKWLDQMDALITEHGLGEEEQLRVGMKRMNLLAKQGDQHGAKLLISKLTSIIKNLSIEHQRVFEYNAACAELALGDAEAAANRVAPLIKAYYKLIGLSPGLMMGNNAPALARMLKKNTHTDDIKHLADALDVLAKTQDSQGQFSPFARIHALKLYDLVRAPDSLFRVGQDLVDQFIANHDFDGALNIMETIILPLLQQWKLADYMITVRSQYAVVLAYCKRYSDAEAEMARLVPYEDALPPMIQQELRSQQKLITELKRDGPPPKWEPPPGLLENIAKYFADKKIMKLPARPGRQKIGRNEKCPCASGKKFKHCHGK